VRVCLNDLDPNAVRVELFADGLNGTAPLRLEMKRERELTAGSGQYAYSAAVSASRPSTDYTARIVPQFTGVAVPLEMKLIRWER
jgi:starch phosphorylase